MTDNLSLSLSNLTITTVAIINYSPKDLNNEQLAVWLSNHPRLRGTDYQHDIQKLKGSYTLQSCVCTTY